MGKKLGKKIRYEPYCNNMLFKDNFSWVTLKFEDEQVFKGKRGMQKSSINERNDNDLQLYLQNHNHLYFN